MIKKIKLTRFLVLLPAILLSVITLSCNNNGENKKDEKTNDSNTVKKPDSTVVKKNADTDQKITPIANARDTAKGIKLVCVDAGMDTSISAPKTDVMLYVDGKLTKLETITGPGTLYSKDDYETMGIPSDAVSACGAWWAGGGQYYYVVVKNGMPVVYQGWQDEGQKKPGYNWTKMKMKTP